MKRRKLNIALTLLVIFILMILVIVYTTRLFLRVSVSNIMEVGEDKASSLAVSLENYLDTAKSVLWVTADTVDVMVKNGDDSGRILRYLIGESKNQASDCSAPGRKAGDCVFLRESPGKPRRRSPGCCR